jgi:hypothetical protein
MLIFVTLHVIHFLRNEIYVYSSNVNHLNSTAKENQTNSDTPHDKTMNQFNEKTVFRFQFCNNNLSQVLCRTLITIWTISNGKLTLKVQRNLFYRSSLTL